MKLFGTKDSMVQSQLLIALRVEFGETKTMNMIFRGSSIFSLNT